MLSLSLLLITTLYDYRMMRWRRVLCPGALKKSRTCKLTFGLIIV